MKALIWICAFTFLIHLTESLTYCFRLAGLRTRQLAIALSFVTSTLLVSRLSNMFQAPLLGTMVDRAVLIGTPATLSHLELSFRVIIFAAFLGSLVGAVVTPTAVGLFERAVLRFLRTGSLPKTALAIAYPRNWGKIRQMITLPNIRSIRHIRLKDIPKGFLILNVFVTSIYTIGVLCSLLAGAYLPELRSTAIQLSGIINGMATILFTIFVDPSGARITDQTYNGHRPESDLKSVIFFLLAGRLLGTLLIAQLFFHPFSLYVMWVTKEISRWFM